MLARMFSGQFLIEEKVPTFIDRDGTQFPFILNFLRDGRVDLPVDDLAKRQLVQEARFYGLPELERQLRQGLSSFLSPLSIVGTKIDGKLRGKSGNGVCCLLHKEPYGKLYKERCIKKRACLNAHLVDLTRRFSEAHSEDRKTIQKLQKKCIRAMSKLPYQNE